MQPNNPLVSIIVITYNSSEFILETLESIKDQTYKNIELIVSDDCSSDRTVEICKEWIENNKSRFVRTELISAKTNSGTSANCNNGFYASKGEWLKFIAGDDALMPECIHTFTKFTYENSDCRIVFGRMYFLRNEQLKEDKINPFFDLTLSEQYLKILLGSDISAPCSFIQRELLVECGGYDESYKLLEDFPMWIKISQKKVLFYAVNEFVVKYRIHNNNISIKNKNFINPRYFSDLKKLLETIVIPELRSKKQFMACFGYLNYLAMMRFIIFLGNKNNTISRILNRLILRNIFV